MSDVRERLKSADPAVHEGPLSDVDVQRMRRAIVAAGERPIAHPIGWKTSWTAVTLAVAATAIFAVNRWREPRVHAPIVPTSDAAQPAESRRQLQFIAPRGTRVIWIFNPDFKP